MSELANAELEKLALYRPGGTIAREDIDALVAEAVPGSTWAFLDAVGGRRGSEAAKLVARLLDEQTPIQVMVSQIHRRLRELVVVLDHLVAGTRPADLVRELKVQPYRAQKLAEQARAWQQAELDAALAALLELDMLSKGIAPDGSAKTVSEDQAQLGLVAWIGNHVARRRRRGLVEARRSRSRRSTRLRAAAPGPFRWRTCSGHRVPPASRSGRDRGTAAGRSRTGSPEGRRRSARCRQAVETSRRNAS